MGLAEWLKEFRQLHARAKGGQLDAAELTRYRAARDELARALLAAQRLTVKPGQVPRRALRVARALQVELDFQGVAERATTLDVSSGGFAALVGRPPRIGDECDVSLRIAHETLRARARVVEVNPGVGNARVAFQFLKVAEDEQEKLELLVFDLVLEAL